MDHQQAIQLGAVERYLLGELPAPQRAQFEEHFFDCRECASELRMTADFFDIARQELKSGNLRSATPKRVKRSWLELFTRPAVLAPAFGLLLAVIAYQNTVVLPRFSGQITRLRQPGIVTMVSLIGGNSRGDALPSISAAAGQPLLLSVDIPATRPYPGYACVLVDASGAVVWRLLVSPAQAQDTVSISVPAGVLRAGNYTLVVQGLAPQDHSDRGNPQASDLARYRFALSPSP
jgi:anti-sigma factor RsiW